jgi:hypothetical protein
MIAILKSAKSAQSKALDKVHGKNTNAYYQKF